MINKNLQILISSKIVSEIATFLYFNEGEYNLTQITEGADIPYLPTHEVRTLSKIGVVETRSVGRPLFVKLSDKGKKVMGLIIEANKHLKDE